VNPPIFEVYTQVRHSRRGHAVLCDINTGRGGGGLATVGAGRAPATRRCQVSSPTSASTLPSSSTPCSSTHCSMSCIEAAPRDSAASYYSRPRLTTGSSRFRLFEATPHDSEQPPSFIEAAPHDSEQPHINQCVPTTRVCVGQLRVPCLGCSSFTRQAPLCHCITGPGLSCTAALANVRARTPSRQHTPVPLHHDAHTIHLHHAPMYPADASPCQVHRADAPRTRHQYTRTYMHTHTRRVQYPDTIHQLCPAS
jgi:hypothetical protein